MTTEEAIGGLIKLYDGKGFYPRHSSIMISIARVYKKGIPLSTKQLKVIKNNVKQYCLGKVKPLPNHEKIFSITLYKKYFRFSFPKDKEMKRELKDTFIDVIFDAEDETWLVPINYFNVMGLKDIKARWSEETVKFVKKYFTFKRPQEVKIKGLRAYQNKGVAFIKSRDGRALLADDMGLGKTIQAIGYMKEVKPFPAVIVCPSVVKYIWKAEIKKWMPDVTVQVLEGQTRQAIMETDITIINYQILSQEETYMTKPRTGKPQEKKRQIGWLKELLKLNPSLIIIDEIQYMMTRGTQRTSACLKLCKKANHVIGLSGTPIKSKPAEFWPILNAIHPYFFPKWTDFANRYCDPQDDGWGIKYKGSSNEQELHKFLTESIMIRRMKSQVLKELPAKQRIIVPVKCSDRKAYRNAMDDFKKWKLENPGSPATKIVFEQKVEMAIAKSKLEECCVWIDDILDTGRKLVVFTRHTEILNYIVDLFKGECVYIDGSVSSKDRAYAVDQFQNNPEIILFVGNLQAAGVGTTLTAAHDVAFFELGWTPGEHDQAEDRIVRIGQTNACTCWYLLVQGTIEEDKAELLDVKRKQVSAIVDGKKVKEKDLLTELMRRI